MLDRVNALESRVRQLVRRPSILALDEPSGALDAKVRRELRSAFGLADRVGNLGTGRILEVGTPDGLRNPANQLVRSFLDQAGP